MRRFVLPIFFCLLAVGLLTLGGCSYYAQAVRGGLEIVCKKRSIEGLLERADLDPGLRERLLVAREIRRFAVAELGLPDNASYRSYADLGRPVVSWTVTAAPELDLVPRQWCFPVAGCVTYRGYFSAEAAERFAQGLRAEGLDVDVGGVRAFSTLGWLADPVLNTFLNQPDTELAALIFHELSHQVVYLKGDTVFNESFATVVEREGVRRWLAGRPNELAVYEVSLRREHQLNALFADTRATLETVYRSEADVAEKRRRKAEALEAARERHRGLTSEWGSNLYGGWFDQGLNNARLASWAAYHERVPELEELLARQGGNLGRFYEEVRRLARGEVNPAGQGSSSKAGLPSTTVNAGMETP